LAPFGALSLFKISSGSVNRVISFSQVTNCQLTKCPLTRIVVVDNKNDRIQNVGEYFLRWWGLIKLLSRSRSIEKPVAKVLNGQKQVDTTLRAEKFSVKQTKIPFFNSTLCIKIWTILVQKSKYFEQKNSF